MMRRRRVSFSSDPRWTALKRAGLAVTVALALLVAVLWFGDSDRPSRPPSESGNAVPAQLPAQRNISAPQADTPAPAPDAPVPAPAPDTTAPDTTAQTTGEPAGVPPPVAVENENAGTPKTSGPKPQTIITAPQKPPSKAIAPPVKPVSLPDEYFVQLGVFDDTDSANSLSDNVSALGLPVHIQFRVVAGPFRSKREAEAARGRLKDIAEGIVLPQEKTAKAGDKPKARSKSRHRAR